MLNISFLNKTQWKIKKYIYIFLHLGSYQPDPAETMVHHSPHSEKAPGSHLLHAL